MKIVESLINEVSNLFNEYDIDEETVKSSLINHDGYDPNIIVRLAQ